MKKIGLSLLFLLMIMTCRAQEEQVLGKNGMLTTNPFSNIFSFNPRLNLGYIRPLSDRILIGLNVGYGNFNLNPYNHDNNFYLQKNYQLIELRPEIYFNLKENNKLKHLISLELFFIHHTDVFTDNYFKDNETNTYYSFDRANYIRNKLGFNINYHLVFNMGSHFAIMTDIGIGTKFRNVKFKNVINIREREEYRESDVGFIGTDYFLTRKGLYIRPNFNFAVKLAYKI